MKCEWFNDGPTTYYVLKMNILFWSYITQPWGRYKLAYRTANFRNYIPGHVVDTVVETVKRKAL